MEKKTILKILKVITVAILFVVLTYFVLDRYKNQGHLLSVKLIDAESGEAIKNNMTVIYQNQQIALDENGIFYINKFKPKIDSTLEIKGQELFMPIRVDITDKNYVEIPIHRGMDIFLDEFVYNLKLNMFRKSYQLIDDATKVNLSETAFLRQANNWMMEIKKDRCDINDISYVINNLINTQESKRIHATISIELSDCDNTSNLRKDAYFVKGGNGWQWEYKPGFFDK